MFGTKLKSIFFRWMGQAEKVHSPVKGLLIKKNEKSLLGKSYYFCCELGEITSPLAGTISRIFPNYCLQITSVGGAQILLTIQGKEADFISLNKVLNREVQAGQKVTPQTILFTVHQPKKIASVVVCVL